jgi:hypothetical protein
MDPNFRAELINAGWLFIRYVAAVITAYFASIFGFLMLLALGITGTPENFWIPPAAAGFAGVFAGALLVAQKSRWIAALVLTGLGIGYYCYFWTNLNYVRSEGDAGNFPHLAYLTAGGILAALIHWLIRRHSMREIISRF